MNTQTQTTKTYRCAIYTRKSHELDAEQDFNTLDAQRERMLAMLGDAA